MLLATDLQLALFRQRQPPVTEFSTREWTTRRLLGPFKTTAQCVSVDCTLLYVPLRTGSALLCRPPAVGYVYFGRSNCEFDFLMDEGTGPLQRICFWN
jgi:hypothetical protein